MLHPHTTGKPSPPAPLDGDILRLRQAGRETAKAFHLSPGSKAACAEMARKAKAASRTFKDSLAHHPLPGADGRWLFENFRLIATAQKETRSVAGSFLAFRTVEIDAFHQLQPLPYAVANGYLRAALDVVSSQGLTAFLEGFQEIHSLKMGELWALKPALQLTLLERISAAAATTTPAVVNTSNSSLAVLITSLRTVAESEWKDLFEQVSVVHHVLEQDPDGTYPRMDYASRDQYRSVIAGLAERSDNAECEIAQIAVARAAKAESGRQFHVGYWLLDNGLPTLREAVAYKPGRRERVRALVTDWPQTYYLIGVELLTLLIVFTLLDGGGMFTPTLFALFLLILPVTQAAVDFMNNLTSFLVAPRVLPKLDFSEGIPDDCATLVAVPTLLLHERQVHQLARDLEIRYLANRDANLFFALVSDSPDSDQAQDHRDALAHVCADLIHELNHRYASEGNTPFYLLHRHRTYNASEGRWMGWERKRGKLLDLNQLLRGGTDNFPLKVGNVEALRTIKYVLTLDSDTQLPRDAAHRLAGTMAHPLHRAVVHPTTKMVVAGYGILQPRIGISIDSASSSRLASIYSGQTGFDIYTRAVSDVYQDLFAEGIFTGKGIYDVDAVTETVEHRFPENALLSHDLIEGVYARAGLVSDIELIDDYPSHFSAYSRRKHRWVRGDWQIMRWLLPVVPGFDGLVIQNPISHISRWKIVDNLRRSLIEPATLFLLVAGWFWLRGTPLYWTLASVAMLLTPVYAGLLFSLPRAPRRRKLLLAWAKDTVSAFLKGHVVTVLQIVFLLHQSMLSVDAIVRSLIRMALTKKKLLEWETAAEAENAQRRSATVDIYLSWSPLVALFMGCSLWVVRPAALAVAAPVLILWVVAPLLSAWLNRAPRTSRWKLRTQDEAFLRSTAVRTWRYFREFSTPENCWLIPDNVREDGPSAERLSPTNLGLLLNSRLAAVHFGYLTVPEFAESTMATLQTVAKLRKHEGHILNWYANETLQPLEPRFISTVDNGNLIACLWTLKQAALAFAQKPPSSDLLRAGLADMEFEAASDESSLQFWTAELAERKRRMLAWETDGMTPDLATRLKEIASACENLVVEMDFAALYHRRKKLLSIGADVDSRLVESSSYDLLASEARIGAFAAIAKGDVPQEMWFHLGRQHTLVDGRRVLLSWTGTIFEYLMPALWMKHYRGTILNDSLQAVVRVQQDFARRKGIPWGISESACIPEIEGGEYGYHAFGIPALAVKQTDASSLVVSPYSTFLALSVNTRASLANLKKMAKLGWYSRYGFYEAADYRDGKSTIIRSWMAHHQGMSLLSVCNLLCDDILREYFHAEPQVLATELLLNERVPTGIEIEKESIVLPALASEAAA